MAGGVAAIAATVLMTVILVLAIGLGASAGGAAAGDATLGAASLGPYGVAIVGIGVAVGGLWRTSLAAEIAALVVVATYLIDLLAPPLGLPHWFHQLALIAHLGQPMVGQWDTLWDRRLRGHRGRRPSRRDVGDVAARHQPLSDAAGVRRPGAPVIAQASWHARSVAPGTAASTDGESSMPAAIRSGWTPTMLTSVGS